MSIQSTLDISWYNITRYQVHLANNIVSIMSTVEKVTARSRMHCTTPWRSTVNQGPLFINWTDVIPQDPIPHIARFTWPTWILSTPGGTHVGPMNLAIRGDLYVGGSQKGSGSLATEKFKFEPMFNNEYEGRTQHEHSHPCFYGNL